MPTDVTVYLGVAGGTQYDRGDMLVPGTLGIDMYSNGQWTCSCTLRSLFGEYLPDVGALIDVYEGGVRVFSGSINEITSSRMVHGYGAVQTEITINCVDFAARLQQRLADPALVWPSGTTAGQIVMDLMSNFAAFEFIQYKKANDGGFVYPGKTSTDIFVADHQSVADLIQIAADLSGYIWFVDSDRILHFQAPQTTIAPFHISSTSNNFKRLEVLSNRGDYWNEEYRQVDYEWQPPTATALYGNSVVREWSLLKPAGQVQKIMLYKGSAEPVEVAIGTPGQNQPYTWQFGSAKIIQAATEPILTNADHINVFHWPIGSNFIISLAETGETAAKRSAYEGNSGKYQIRIDDGGEINGPVAQTKADRDVALWANIQVGVAIDGHGFDNFVGIGAIFPRPGMVVNVNLQYPLIHQDCFIQEVTARHVPANGFAYTFKAYNVQRIGNVIDFFRELTGQSGGGGGGAGAVSVGPPGPPGPPYEETLAPNVSGSASVFYMDKDNGQVFGFDGQIILPIGHINLSHLKKIEVYAYKQPTPTVAEPAILIGVFFSWVGSPIPYALVCDTQPTVNETWYVQFVCYNENDTTTPNPFTSAPIVVKAAAVSAVSAREVDGAHYQDERDGMHTVVIITPTVNTIPTIFTFWLDFADGRGWVWQGWRDYTTSGQTYRVGDAYTDSEGTRGAGHIWVPTDPDKTNWKVAAYAGAINSTETLPALAVQSSFTVKAVEGAKSNDVKNAFFVLEPTSGSRVVYTKQATGDFTWHFHELQWEQPSIIDNPDYWFSFLTVQKGRRDTSGIWHPAPDREGVDEDPSIYSGRKVTDSGAIQKGNSKEGTIVSVRGDTWGDWTYPPNLNEDGTPNLYRSFRFWIWSVSRRGTDETGGTGAIMLNNCWEHGLPYYDLDIAAQPKTLDLTLTLPRSLGPGMGKDAQDKVVPILAAPLEIINNAIALANKSITEDFLHDQSVHANHMAEKAITFANKAMDANVIVDENVIDVGVTKLIHGTRIFTGNVILSRGSANPVLVLANDGLSLFGVAATGGASGLTTSPHVVVDNTGIGVFQGGTGKTGPSVTVNAVGVTIWESNGVTTKPYVAVASGAIKLKNDKLTTDITAAQITMSYATGVSLAINAAGMKIVNGNTNVDMTSAQLTMSYTSGPVMTLDATQIKFKQGAFAVIIQSGFIQLWSSDGNSALPYLGMTGTNIYIGAGAYEVNVSASKIIMSHSSGASLALTSADVKIQAGVNKVTVSSTNLLFENTTGSEVELTANQIILRPGTSSKTNRATAPTIVFDTTGAATFTDTLGTTTIKGPRVTFGPGGTIYWDANVITGTANGLAGYLDINVGGAHKKLAYYNP